MSPPQPTLEDMARRLEESGAYRVLRRLEVGPRTLRAPPATGPVRSALFVDVETTGLDPARDEIIELAMAPFSYDAEGHVLQVGEAFEGFRDPGRPIPEAVSRLTGITDEMVRGRMLDLAAIERFAGSAALVIAHNAAFDRRFLERLSPTFVTKPWACSMSQVDWALDGHEGAKLVHLCAACGFFYDQHRAANDCFAAVELLGRGMRNSPRTALACLLEAARRPTFRIWAEQAPFEMRDLLKARGYKWNPDPGPAPRAWYIDVPEEQREAETAFLAREIYGHEVAPLIKRLDAYNRFSDRV